MRLPTSRIAALPTLALAALLVLASVPTLKAAPASAGPAAQVIVDSGPQQDGILKSDFSRSVPAETSVDRKADGCASANEAPSTPSAAARDEAATPHPAARRAQLHVYRL